MFNRDRVTNEQIRYHYLESCFCPLVGNQLGIDIIRSVDVSKEDDGVHLLVLLVGLLVRLGGRMDDVCA